MICAVAGCRDSPAAQASGGQKAAAPPTGAATSAGTSRGPVVMDERFTPRVIPDAQQGGMPVGVMQVPEKWRFDSSVVWNYAYHSNAVALSSSAVNPANEEALFGYAAAEFFDLRPSGGGYFQLGQNYGGMIYAHPQPPAQTLAGFIQYVRRGAPQLQFVGSKDLPELPAALKLPPPPHQQGVGVKVTYELNGKPVEEEFYAVAYSLDIPFAAAGRLSRQISANNDAMIAAIDRQLEASRPSASPAGTRSSADKFDDYIRGVDTVDDPYYGTSQHSYTEQFHWTDGYGNYRNSNDASYDPNRSEVGQWQVMRPTR